MTDLTPNDLSHLSDEGFNALAPQGYHATGPAEPLGTRTDFRALCAELHAAFNTYAVDEAHHDLLVRTEAALARPTDEEILRIAAKTIEPYETRGIAVGEYEAETKRIIEVYGSELIAFARAVLDRWGGSLSNAQNQGVPQ